MTVGLPLRHADKCCLQVIAGLPGDGSSVACSDLVVCLALRGCVRVQPVSQGVCRRLSQCGTAE